MSASSRARSLKCDHGLHRQAIVDSLLNDIVHGRVQAGQRLVTQALAERFGLSHTPIREALLMLAGLGVVDLLPNRGSVVRRLSARDVRELSQVRRALECEAVRLACGRIDPAELETLRDVLRRLVALKALGPDTIAEAREADTRLHGLIAASAHNSFLVGELTRLGVLIRAFRTVALEYEVGRRDFRFIMVESRDHLEIAEALLARDRKRAVAAMSRHILWAGRYWIRTLAEATPEASSSRGRPGANGRRKSR